MKNVFVALGLATEDEPKTGVLPDPKHVPPMPPISPLTAPPSFNSQIAQAQAVFQPAQSLDPSKDQEIMDKLQASLMEGKMASASYLDFAALLANMEKMLGGADERTKFMAAFAALSAQGVTPDTVVNTAQHYLDILDSEETGFSNMMIGRVKNEVQSKIDEQNNLDKKITDANEQIQALTKSIMDMNIQKIELGNAAAQAKSGLETYANTFQSAKHHLTEQILSTIQRFQVYVMPTTPK